MYEWRGVDSETGEALYTGKEKDLVHEAANAKMIQTGKSSIPDVYGGISTSWAFFGVAHSSHTRSEDGHWIPTTRA